MCHWIRLYGGLALPALLFASTALGATPTRELTLHPTIFDALADAIGQATASTRQTFYPVAVFRSETEGRGSILVTSRRQIAPHGDCLEVAFSGILTDHDKKLKYFDLGRMVCEKTPGSGYDVHPEIPVNISDVRKQRARSFLPPSDIAAGATWRIANREELFPHSLAGAIAVGVGQKTLPYALVWENPTDRGALYAYPSKDSAGCVKIASRMEPVPASGRQFAAEYCPLQGEHSGWERTVAKAPSPEDMAVINPKLDEAFQTARWANVRQNAPAKAVASVTAASPAGSTPAPAPARPVATAVASSVPPKNDATGAGAATQPTTIPANAPRPASATNEARRVLAPFTGYADATMCDDGSMGRAGVPWRPDAGNGDPLDAGRRNAYLALLRNAMRSLRTLYGSLSAEEDKSFEAFFAPYFDHPTRGTHEYFERLTPLLDELIQRTATLDGVLPAFGESLQEAILFGAQPATAATGTAASTLAAVRSEREGLERVHQQIVALGNPPNPVAAKCAARARHHKALGGESDLVKLLRQTTYVAGVSDDTGAGDIEVAYTTWGNESRDKLDAKVSANRPQTQLTWNGLAFSYRSRSKNFDAPCTKSPTGEGSSQDLAEIQGSISPDGWVVTNVRGSNVQRNCEDEKSGRYSEERTAFEIARAPLYLDKPISAGPERIELFYTNITRPLPPDLKNVEFKKGEVFMRFANFLRTHEMDFCGAIACATLSAKALEECTARVERECAAKKAARGNPGTQKDTAPASASTATGNKASGTPATALPPDEAALAQKEAIAQHEALAAQIQKDAARWAEDARREKDAKRREELEKRALETAANAQAERDVAASLRQGTLVKTRTEWDERQHKSLVDSIQKELAGFDVENRLIRNLPKAADLVGGAEGVQLRSEMQTQLSDALKSPDRQQKLEALYAQVKERVVAQGERQMADEAARVAQWESRVAMAENTAAAAGMAVTLATLWSPATMGSLALGYAGATGMAEDGAVGATKAVVRSVSNKADVLISAYEGATRIDPATGQPAGAWGAAEGALWAIGTNKVFETAGKTIGKAKAEYALIRQGQAAPGVKAVARPGGEARLKEFDFKTPAQRYQQALATAKTPEQTAEVKKRHAIEVERETMQRDKEAALRKAEETVRAGKDEKSARAELARDLDAVHEKFKGRETRNQQHADILRELGFDTTSGPSNKDLAASGGAAVTAASDLDFTPRGATPLEANQKGRKYAEALIRRGHQVLEYGDRWVDSTTDTTVWKAGYNADRPGSGSFEAEVIFGTLPGSDKFGTRGGIEWTSSATQETPDPLGAVLANLGKAVGAGLGSGHPRDLHVVGKSAVKAAEIAGISVDPVLKAQIDALRAHQPPELAGVIPLGADASTRARQEKAFLDKVQSLMGRAIESARSRSEKNLQGLESQAASAAPEQAVKLRTQIKAYQSGNSAAMATIAQTAPGFCKVFATSAAPAGRGERGVLRAALAFDRDAALKATTTSANASDAAFATLGPRCKEAARRADEKFKAAKAGSDEARYLAQLRDALAAGATNPAEAVRSVRGVSGTELAIVLRQLGVREMK